VGWFDRARFSIQFRRAGKDVPILPAGDLAPHGGQKRSAAHRVAVHIAEHNGRRVTAMSLKGSFRNFILSLFFILSFGAPAFGVEVRNLLYEVNDPYVQCSPGENPGSNGFIQNVNKFDNPVEFVDRRKTPAYDSIGVVDSGTKYGTGFLFGSPCYVMSNFHVVFGERFYKKFVLGQKVDMSNNLLAKERVRFKVGVTSDPSRFRDEVEATPVVWGDFSDALNPANDWALLKLERCLDQYERLSVPLSNPEGIFKALDQGVKPGVLGYYSDISKTQLYVLAAGKE
jgi:hypothetical protein